MSDEEIDTGKEGEGNDEGDFFDNILTNEVEFDEGDITDGKDKGELKEDDKGGKKVTPTLDDVLAKVSALEAKNTELEKATRRAFYNERQDKKALKADDKKEVTLTDAEIKAIIKDNKDDPEVMFNAVTYKVQQMMKEGKKSTVDEVEVRNKNSQLLSMLRERAPDYDKEDSQAAEIIAKSKDYFSLDNHPHGDFLAAAAAVYADFPNILKQWFEAGKKAALDDKADANRKKEIKDGQITPGGNRVDGKDKVSGKELNSSEMETFERIFGNVRDPADRKKKLDYYRSQIISKRKAA